MEVQGTSQQASLMAVVGGWGGTGEWAVQPLGSRPQCSAGAQGFGGMGVAAADSTLQEQWLFRYGWPCGCWADGGGLVGKCVFKGVKLVSS